MREERPACVLLLHRLRRSAGPNMRDTGGEWTTQKLDAVQRYLSAYATAQRDQGFSTSYIDVFAGARYCVDDPAEAPLFTGFPNLAGADAKAFLTGSSRIALAVNPPFDGYMFIERNRQRCRVLEALSQRFPDRNVHIRSFESNREIQRLCALKWHARGALLFVDAYAAELKRDTIAAVAQTGAIDLWVLFPLGFAIFSALPRRLMGPLGAPRSQWRSGYSNMLLTDRRAAPNLERTRPTARCREQYPQP
jgi:three-Cys-motif partner protein